MLLSASSFALAGFPLDDMWHRLFGQDVTLWGPTHLVLIGGAGLATVGALILLGLFGIFAAGVIAIALPEGKPSRVAVKLGRDWYAPLGGIVLITTSSFALAGFPLDDGWHRLFGQDVTLWGPTHLMLIGGAGLSLLGMALLMVEGGHSEENADDGSFAARAMAVIYKTRFAGVAGGLLIGLSTCLLYTSPSPRDRS